MKIDQWILSNVHAWATGSIYQPYFWAKKHSLHSCPMNGRCLAHMCQHAMCAANGFLGANMPRVLQMDSWVSPRNISLPFFTLDTPKLVMYPYYKQYYEYNIWSHLSTSIINVCGLWKFWIFHKPAPFFTWNTLLTKGQNVGGCRIRKRIKKKKNSHILK